MSVFLPNPWMQVIQPLKHTLSPRNASVQYAVRVDGGDFTNAVTAADINFRAAFDNVLDSNVNFLPAQGYAHLTSGELVEVTSTQVAAPGLSAINSLPSNNAVIIRKRTSFAGRKWRGRIYLPWAVNETSVNEVGQLLTSSITQFQAAADAWLAANEANAALNGIWLLHAGPSLGPGTTPTRVTQLTVNPVIATQRRRLVQPT